MPEMFDPNVQLSQAGLAGPTDSLDARRKMLEERRAKLKAYMAKNMAQPEGQMVSGHFVAPHWAQYLGPLADKFQQGMEQRQLDEATLAQGVAEKAQLRDALTQLSGSPGEAATPFGSRDEPRQDAVQATPPPTGADRRAIIAKLMDNPAAGALGGELLKDDLISAPIRAEARDARKAEADAARLERGDQLAADRVARAELAKQRSEDLRLTLAQRQQAAQEHNDLMRELAAGRLAAQRDALAAKGEKPAKPVNLTAAQQKAYDDSDALLGHIDNALASIKANPNALGKKTLIPDVALTRIDPEGVQTRAAVAGLSAEKVHQLSGAAVSPAEFARLRPYLPASGDDDATATKKLTNLRAEVERIKAIHARGPTRATGGASGSWGETKAPAGISLPPGFKYVGPAQ